MTAGREFITETFNSEEFFFTFLFYLMHIVIICIMDVFPGLGLYFTVHLSGNVLFDESYGSETFSDLFINFYTFFFTLVTATSPAG